MDGEENPLTVMVSSTVYDIRFLLDQIEATLKGFGYKPWISAKGTIPVNPDLGNFDNCLRAVAACDLYFGIITPAYGTGKQERGGQSITHRELLEAIRLDKPRWIVCHESIMTARSFLNDLSYEGVSLRGREGREKLSLKPDPAVLKNLKTIDMLEAAQLEGVLVAERRGNWVQPYSNDRDVLTYISTQFDERTRVQGMLEDRAKRLDGSAAESSDEAIDKPVSGDGTGESV